MHLLNSCKCYFYSTVVWNHFKSHNMQQENIIKNLFAANSILLPENVSFLISFPDAIDHYELLKIAFILILMNICFMFLKGNYILNLHLTLKINALPRSLRFSAYCSLFLLAHKKKKVSKYREVLPTCFVRKGKVCGLSVYSNWVSNITTIQFVICIQKKTSNVTQGSRDVKKVYTFFFKNKYSLDPCNTKYAKCLWDQWALPRNSYRPFHIPNKTSKSVHFKQKVPKNAPK